MNNEIERIKFKDLRDLNRDELEKLIDIVISDEQALILARMNFFNSQSVINYNKLVTKMIKNSEDFSIRDYVLDSEDYQKSIDNRNLAVIQFSVLKKSLQALTNKLTTTTRRAKLSEAENEINDAIKRNKLFLANLAINKLIQSDFKEVVLTPQECKLMQKFIDKNRKVIKTSSFFNNIIIKWIICILFILIMYKSFGILWTSFLTVACYNYFFFFSQYMPKFVADIQTNVKNRVLLDIAYFDSVLRGEKSFDKSKLSIDYVKLNKLIRNNPEETYFIQKSSNPIYTSLDDPILLNKVKLKKEESIKWINDKYNTLMVTEDVLSDVEVEYNKYSKFYKDYQNDILNKVAPISIFDPELRKVSIMYAFKRIFSLGKADTWKEAINVFSSDVKHIELLQATKEIRNDVNKFKQTYIDGTKTSIEALQKHSQKIHNDMNFLYQQTSQMNTQMVEVRNSVDYTNRLFKDHSDYVKESMDNIDSNVKQANDTLNKIKNNTDYR